MSSLYIECRKCRDVGVLTDFKNFMAKLPPYPCPACNVPKPEPVKTKPNSWAELLRRKNV
jgi:hypothetical protein